MNEFLKQHTCYDVLPISFKLVVFDTHLPIKKALSLLVQNGIVSAPLWSSETQTFAGMLTVSDFISLIQYYYHHPHEQYEIETIQISRLYSNSTYITLQQNYPTHPMTSLYDIALLMSRTRAHRIPLVIENKEIISIITQYRLMKFIANNFKQTELLKVPISQLNLGTYADKVATCSMSTPVIQIIDLCEKLNISAVPIIDKQGIVLNLYDTIDIMSIVMSEKYGDLDLPVSEALKSRPADYTGVPTCTMNDTLYAIFKAIRKKRVYRLVIVEPETNKLVGILSLSDILGYIVTL